MFLFPAYFCWNCCLILHFVQKIVREAIPCCIVQIWNCCFLSESREIPALSRWLYHLSKDFIKNKVGFHFPQCWIQVRSLLTYSLLLGCSQAYHYIFNLRHSGRHRNQLFYMEIHVTIGTGLLAKLFMIQCDQHRTRCKNIKYLISQKLFVLSFISYPQSTAHLPSAPATSTKIAPTHFISLLQSF